VSAGNVFGELLWLEPQGNLLLSGLDGVGPVADVTPDLNAVVAADGAGLGVLGVGLAKHHAASLDDASSLPDHGHDGSGSHVLDESGEEGLGGKVGVVLLQKLLISLHEFHGNELEPLLLKPLDDFTNESTLDTVRLDHDESPLICHLGSSRLKGFVDRVGDLVDVKEMAAT